MVVRVLVGIVGGLIIFVFATMIFSFMLARIFEGLWPLDMIVGGIMPFVLGLLAGVHTFWRSVWPKKDAPPEGACQHCGYNLTGNVSGVCPECGEKIR